MAAELMTTRDLDAAIRAVDPRARVVPARVLRRIIKSEQKLGVLGLHLEHRRSLTIRANAALRAVSAEELGLDGAQAADYLLLLIVEPDPAMPRCEALTWAWRRLFHARIHAGFAADRPGADAVLARIAAIGEGAFAEARAVLDRDGWLSSPRDDASTYEEFAAVFLELRAFAEALQPVYFPRIDDFDRVASILTQDVDAGAIFAESRPEGAPRPAPHPVVDDPPREAVGPETDEVSSRSEARARWMIARADRARALGNSARSAIFRTCAARLVGPTLAGRARAGAADDLDSLARRLSAAVGSDATEGRDVRGALVALVARVGAGWSWSAEARLLYDLQTVCVDHEREIYALDLARWLLTFGKRPLKRPLPNQRLIRTSRHLRRAAGRVARVRIAEVHRANLSALIHDARERAERDLRERFRPLVAQSFDRAGVKAGNLPEAVSFDRMTDELLDRLVERDHLTMGDARDALARSDLRQPDLSGPRDLWRGDRVLRANRRLAVSLDGVYRSGEIYLRALQAWSLLAFGTKVGRWLTRYVALPYGGAFGLLFTLQELVEIGQKLAAMARGASFHHEDVFRFTNLGTVAAVGTVILLILHSDRFRAIAWKVASGLGRTLKFALYDGPAWILSRPIVKAIARSRAFDMARRIVLQPLALAASSAGLVYWLDHDWRVAATIGGVAFAATAFFLGTAFGREMEERAADLVLRTWRRVRVDLLPGLARMILDIFNAILQGVEGVLYAVDERLRFREGQGRWTLRAKAVAGLIWGAITYVVRIYINLLVEPTINPLKHFPTVTVAAKLIIPVLDRLYFQIAAALWFLGKWPAGAFASITVVFLPGLAGFIVWELKENWRLFEANRPRDLQPSVIGHHGETMRRLIVPGFHSGTVPKIFAKLRRAERQAYRTGLRAPARKARETLHHVEEPIRRFVERGFLSILARSGRFGACDLRVTNVELATNRVVVEVGPSDGGPRFQIRFEDDRCDLATIVLDEGWRAGLTPELRELVDAAMRGVAARAGAVAVRGDVQPIAAISQPGGSATTVPWVRWVAFWEGARGDA